MTVPCLHCAIWDAIRDHARDGRSVLNGKVLCDRAAVSFALTIVLSDLVLSEPDQGRRAALVENVNAVLRGAAVMPRCEQPREDLEVVSWQ